MAFFVSAGQGNEKSMNFLFESSNRSMPQTPLPPPSSSSFFSAHYLRAISSFSAPMWLAPLLAHQHSQLMLLLIMLQPACPQIPARSCSYRGFHNHLLQGNLQRPPYSLLSSIYGNRVELIQPSHTTHRAVPQWAVGID